MLAPMKRFLASTLAAVALGVACVSAVPDRAHAAETVIEPGIGISIGPTATRTTICSLGFIGFGPDGKAVGFTAGHCADFGTEVWNEARTEHWGTIVYSRVNHSGDDIARIRFDGRNVPPQVNISVPVEGRRLPIAGAMSDDELNATRPLLCRIGRTTDMSCAAPHPMEAVRHPGTLGVSVDNEWGEPGDSGGPIFAVVRDEHRTPVAVRPVAVVVGVDSGTNIAPFAEQWGVSLTSKSLQPGTRGVSGPR